MRNRGKVRTIGIALGVVFGSALGWAADMLGASITGWAVGVPVAIACTVLSMLVQGTLDITVDAAMSRASLVVKVGWLWLSLGEVEGAVTIFRKAHTELLSTVGASITHGYGAAPSLARALCESGQRDAAVELIAEVETAEMRCRSWSVFDLRRYGAANWDRSGKLLHANMRVAVHAPDAEVQGLLSEASSAGLSTPAGSRVYTRAGEGAFVREQLVFTVGGLREWEGFLQRRARGEGERELNDAWATYTCVTDENIGRALDQREKLRENDEQQRRNANAGGLHSALHGRTRAANLGDL